MKLDFVSDDVVTKPSASSYVDAGMQAHKAGAFDLAVDRYIAALREDPDQPDALNNLSVILTARGKFTAAVVCARRALAMAPRDPRFLGNLAHTLYRMDLYSEARLASEAAIERDPKSWSYWHILGLVHHAEGNFGDSIRCLEEANRIFPGSEAVVGDLALSYFGDEQWQKGFKLHRSRWPSLKRGPFWDSGIPEWRGQDLTNKTLVIHHEQGFGDTIQFSRFVPLVRKYNPKEVILSVPWQLLRLFRDSDLDVKISEFSEPVAVDYHCPMMNMPQFVDISAALEQEQKPYLKADVPLVVNPRRAPETLLSVGVAWAGSPSYSRDKQRSMPFEEILALCDIPGVQVYSLQIGPRREDISKSFADAVIQDPTPLVNDFADLATLVSKMDLVVAVDTAVLHLAGALGKPCIALLPYAACWRWASHDRDYTPFYPTMKLVRQKTPGDWSDVMRRTREILAERLDAVPTIEEQAAD